MSALLHVRFAPKATEVLRCRELTGRAPVVSHALPAKKHPYSIISSVPAIRGTGDMEYTAGNGSA
jgi:hypothetical protein